MSVLFTVLTFSGGFITIFYISIYCIHYVYNVFNK